MRYVLLVAPLLLCSCRTLNTVDRNLQKAAELATGACGVKVYEAIDACKKQAGSLK